MALRANKSDTSKESYDYGLNSAVNAFSIDAFREANKVVIYIEGKGKDPVEVFRAYYQGNFSFNAALDVGSLNTEMLGTLNGLGPIWRSTIKSIGRTVSGGEAWSGAFDTPYKPYIKGTLPLTFELKCVLPLIQKDNPDNPFVKHIQTPINNLLAITMPTESKAFDSVATKIGETVQNAIDWLFSDTEGTFWECTQNVIEGFKKDFFGGIYMLNNPAQFDNANELVLRIGPWRVPKVMINTVKVEYSPLMYTDGSTVYPSFAWVTVSCQTTNKARFDTFNINTDFESKLNEYMPDGHKIGVIK